MRSGDFALDDDNTEDEREKKWLRQVFIVSCLFVAAMCLFFKLYL